MPTQTVGNRQPDELSLFEVTIADGFPTDVSSLVVRARASDVVMQFKKRLAAILDCPWERVILTSMEEPTIPLTNREHVPQAVLVRDAWDEGPYFEAIYVEFNIEQNGDSFVLKCPRGITHEQLIRRLAYLLSRSEEQVELLDIRGDRWQFPVSVAQTRVAVSAWRGGVSLGDRSRSVSPTMPFHQGASAGSEGRAVAEESIDRTPQHRQTQMPVQRSPESVIREVSELTRRRYESKGPNGVGTIGDTKVRNFCNGGRFACTPCP